MAAREFVMKNLGYTHCVTEIEYGVGKPNGISRASFDFVSKTLRVELLNENCFSKFISRIQEIVQSHEPGIQLTEYRIVQAGERVSYLKGLSCTNCAAKTEHEAQKLGGTREVQVSSIAQRMTLKASNRKRLSVLIREIMYIIGRIEPDVTVSFREEKTGEDEGGGRKRISCILLVVGIMLSAAAMAISMVELPSFLFFLTTYLLISGRILLIALCSIRRGQIFGENFLVSTAIIDAFTIGEFPEDMAVMLFCRVRELFQDMAVNCSRSSIRALMGIRPDFASLKPGNGIRRISPKEVGIGGLILVRTGKKIPLDGVVVRGISSLGTSALTGESLPRDVQLGSEILSGSVNQGDLLTVRVQKRSRGSTASRILGLVQSVSGRKTPAEDFITKFARYYALAVVFAALALAVVPSLMVPGMESRSWIYHALAFLVISCPCAFVILVPLNFFGGIGAASRQGTLVRGSSYPETLNGLNTVVLDKTGALIKGSFTVTEILPEKMKKTELLHYAALARSVSTHPIVQSIVRVYDQPVDEGQAMEHAEVVGHGIRAIVNGKTALARNSCLVGSENIRFEPASAPGLLVYLMMGGEYAGCLMVSDETKPDSRRAVEVLRQAGVHTVAMLIGGSQAMAEGVAKAIGIDIVYSELLSSQKVRRMKPLDSQKSPSGRLAFVGNSIDGASILARADIGVAMGSIGSGITVETTDIVLMTGELSKLSATVRVAKKMRHIVWQSIWFILGIKAVILILTAVEIITMWAVVFGDVDVTPIAVLDAIRALKTKQPHTICHGLRFRSNSSPTLQRFKIGSDSFPHLSRGKESLIIEAIVDLQGVGTSGFLFLSGIFARIG